MIRLEVKNFSDAYKQDITTIFRPRNASGGVASNVNFKSDLREFKRVISYKLDFTKEYVDVPIQIYPNLPKEINKDLGVLDAVFFVDGGTTIKFNNFGDALVRAVFTEGRHRFNGTPLKKAVLDKDTDDEEAFYYYFGGGLLDADLREIFSINYRLDTDTGNIIKIIFRTDPRVLMNGGALHRNVRNRLLCYLTSNSFYVRSLLREDFSFEIRSRFDLQVEISSRETEFLQIDDFYYKNNKNFNEKINKKAHSKEFIDSIFE